MGRTAIMYIAERCNQSCVFCLEEDGSWNEFVDPSTQQVLDTIGELRRRGAEHITFMGGETFFRKDLPRILHETKQRGFTRVGVTTNGTVLSKAGFVRDLTAAGLDFIEFSMHGHTAEVANAIGGTKFTFERQLVALGEIDALGTLPVIVNVVICEENRRTLFEVAELITTSFPHIRARFKFKFASLSGLALTQANEGHLVRHDDVDFVALGDKLTALGVPFWFYNVPLCKLGAHAGHSHELGSLTGGETYFDFDHRSNDGYYDSGDQLEGRVWPADGCRTCTVRPLCPGVEEPYRAAAGDVHLQARSDDPVALVAASLVDGGLDPARAAERWQKIRDRSRPATFEKRRPEGAVRFTRTDAPPLDLDVEEKTPKTQAFFTTPRFAISYRRWSDAEPTRRDDVRELMESACRALKKADELGLALAGARHAVGAAACAGWSAEAQSDAPVPRKKRVPLPLLGPNGEMI